MKQSPLSHLKVVEFAGIGPVPFAGMMLADLGAEVVLIERKQNSKDDLVPDAQRQNEIYHRGKQSIAIDLKSPEGIQLALKIIESADVVIEGFRPGVMERLGLGPDECFKLNPSLIYGRLTGWGQTGPLAKTAAHEPNYTALSGALWYGGRADHHPTAPLSTMGDVGAGSMSLIIGVLSALLDPNHKQRGQVIDASIADSSAYNSTLLWSLFHIGMLSPNFGENWADGGAPWNETYQCKDGKFITICALEPKFYALLLSKLSLQDDPTFKQQWNKGKWPEMKIAFTALFESETRDHWSQLLEGSDSCYAPVLDFNEAPQHPHNQARETFVEINNKIQPAPVPKFSNSELKAGEPPKVSQHANEIVSKLNLTQEQVEALFNNKII